MSMPLPRIDEFTMYIYNLTSTPYISVICYHVHMFIKGWSVTTNLDPPFFVPPGPYILKYLDPPALIFLNPPPLHVINYIV